jgi:hypothetical protein
MVYTMPRNKTFYRPKVALSPWQRDRETFLHGWGIAHPFVQTMSGERIFYEGRPTQSSIISKFGWRQLYAL